MLGTDVVADIVAASLGGSASTQGITAQVEETARYAGGGGFPKAVSGADLRVFDTTIVRDKPTGLVTYHYVFSYSISVSNMGNSVDVHSTVVGSIQTPRLASSDSSLAAIGFTHVSDADTQFTVNATFRRFGTTRSKVGDRLSFTSSTAATLTDVKVNKSTYRIDGGTAEMAINGLASNTRIFAYTVQVTFLGNNQALLTINEDDFSVDLASGTATPAGE